MNSTLRLFLAIEPDIETRDALNALSKKLQQEMGNKNFRWIAPENFHITLYFIGACPMERITELTKEINKICSNVSPFPLHFGSARSFPTPSHPRVLIVTINPTAELLNLFKQLKQSITTAGFKSENRAYVPHLSLARLNYSKIPNLNPDIKIMPKKLMVHEIALLHSELIEEKRVYTALQRFPLSNSI